MTQIAESVSVEVGGAQVLIPREVIVKNWLATALGTPAPASLPEPITLAALRPGERYAGLILGKDGEPSYHLILLDGEAEDVSWDDAKVWATTIGGELPTRREQSLLYANLKEEFQGAWYWSGEQSESYSDDAWGQDFGDGDQNDYRKDLEFRARAVRRLSL